LNTVLSAEVMGCCVCTCIYRKLGGIWNRVEESYNEENGMSAESQQLVSESMAGLDVSKILDVHVHLIGIHPEDSGCYVHENMSNPCQCQSYMKKFIIAQAAGMDIVNQPDNDDPYWRRLVQLFEHFIPQQLQQEAKRSLREQMERKDDSVDRTVSNEILDRPFCPKAVLLGLDQVYNKESGIPEPQHTSVYTPETFVEKVVNLNRHVFLMGPSINPYRKDAVRKLEEFKAKGCNLIKWLPNSMGIDPRDEQCDAFFDKMAELDMFLLSHTGHEHSLDDAGYTKQEYGNPLRLRRALDKGVKVIMAHCASEGSDEDLDDERQMVNSCDLFIRMMREDRYRGLLFGDISAMTAFKRTGALVKIIQCSDFHDRLIYGSDYPVPAINAVVWYGKLVRYGLITESQADSLRDIFKFNPCLADFVSKRIMRFQDDDGKVHRFADVIFQQYPLLCGNEQELVLQSDEHTPLLVSQ